MINGKMDWTLPEYFTLFSGFCNRLDINITDSKDISVKIEVATYRGEQFQILVTDPEMALYYAIYTENLQGDRLETGFNSEKYFALDLEEMHWMEGNGECTNYGVGRAFKTYADCIANDYDKIFRPRLGCSLFSSLAVSS